MEKIQVESEKIIENNKKGMILVKTALLILIVLVIFVFWYLYMHLPK